MDRFNSQNTPEILASNSIKDTVVSVSTKSYTSFSFKQDKWTWRNPPVEDKKKSRGKHTWHSLVYQITTHTQDLDPVSNRRQKLPLNTYKYQMSPKLDTNMTSNLVRLIV